MSRPRWRGSSVVVGVMVFAWAFGLYAVTMGDLVGYEPETAAVTEGFVRTGHFAEVRGSPLQADGHLGVDGRLVGRVGLPQPLLEAPFYALGMAIDGGAKSDDGIAQYSGRRVAILFYNPFAMALAAALVFGIVLTIRGSRRWALLVAILFAVGSLAWPYAKIGMETTLTLAVALSVFAVVRAARETTVPRWALIGFATGMAFAVKPYVAPVLLPSLFLLLPALRPLATRRRLHLVAAALVPLVAWLVAVGWYNHVRQGSITDFGNASYHFTYAAPFNFIGYLVSPGKGLVWYSPLVVLGFLGLRRLASEDRRLAWMLGGIFLLGVLAVSGTNFWGDETWGPRYIVNVAWIPLLAIPWWGRDLRARRILGATATVAVAVQLLAIAVPYGVYLSATKELTGLPIYPRFGPHDERHFVTNVPLGDDPPRWIPQISPLVFQTALVASRVADSVGGRPLTYFYGPHEGQPHRVQLSRYETYVPDFWWRFSKVSARAEVVTATIMLLIAGLGWVGMRRSGLSLRATPRRPDTSRA